MSKNICVGLSRNPFTSCASARTCSAELTNTQARHPGSIACTFWYIVDALGVVTSTRGLFHQRVDLRDSCSARCRRPACPRAEQLAHEIVGIAVVAAPAGDEQPMILARSHPWRGKRPCRACAHPPRCRPSGNSLAVPPPDQALRDCSRAACCRLSSSTFIRASRRPPRAAPCLRRIVG